MRSAAADRVPPGIANNLSGIAATPGRRFRDRLSPEVGPRAGGDASTVHASCCHGARGCRLAAFFNAWASRAARPRATVRAGGGPTPAPARAKEALIEALPLEERILRRAYELYVERGNQSGSELDDWLQAEQEVLQAQEQR